MSYFNDWNHQMLHNIMFNIYQTLVLIWLNVLVSAHSCVLAAASVFLKEMVAEDSSQNRNITLQIPDISSRVLLQVLSFIYIGTYIWWMYMYKIFRGRQKGKKWERIRDIERVGEKIYILGSRNELLLFYIKWRFLFTHRI